MRLYEVLLTLLSSPLSLLILIILLLLKRNLERSAQDQEVQPLRQQVECLTAECSALREQQAGLEQMLRDNNLILEQLEHRLLVSEESLAQRIDALSSKTSMSAIHIHNGILLWKIDGYLQKQQDALNGVQTALFSPPFYSADYGYKMCAVIFLNGNGIGEGSHLSLFFVVMRGDYDALQAWPFQKKITMMLLDQGNGDHMIDAFHSDPQSSSFQRPKSDMNDPSVRPRFMPLNMLNDRQYIKDDVMFIKIIVETSDRRHFDYT